MTEERWLPVVGWEEFYEVSDAGRVKSLPRTSVLHHGGVRIAPGGIRRLATHEFGYKTVLLSRKERRITRSVHTMVLEAFVGPRPEGLVACHNNGDPADNRPVNLRWDTQSSNLLDAVGHGTHTLANRTHCSHGHEYTAENTIWSREGWRSCRECKRAYDKEHWPTRPPRPRRPPRPVKTHCPQGHEYTPENSQIKPPKNPGNRPEIKCRICNNEQRKAKRAAARALRDG